MFIINNYYVCVLIFKSLGISQFGYLPLILFVREFYGGKQSEKMPRKSVGSVLIRMRVIVSDLLFCSTDIVTKPYVVFSIEIATHTHTHTQTRARAYTHIHIHTHTHTQRQIHTRTHARTHVHTHTHTTKHTRTRARAYTKQTLYIFFLLIQ